MRYWYPCLHCRRAVIGVMPVPCYYCKTGKKPPRNWKKIGETKNHVTWQHMSGTIWVQTKGDQGPNRRVQVVDDKLVYKMEEFDPR